MSDAAWTLAPGAPDEAFVRAAGLPVDGLANADFVVARERGVLVGCAGIECRGAVALLRTVIVAPSHRGKGLAGLLVADRVRAARAHGATALYLLTTGAADYFARLGFARVAAIPPELSQAALAECRSATAMTLAL